MVAPWKESYHKHRQHIKKPRHLFANRCLYSQSCGLYSSLCVYIHIYTCGLYGCDTSWKPRTCTLSSGIHCVISVLWHRFHAPPTTLEAPQSHFLHHWPTLFSLQSEVYPHPQPRSDRDLLKLWRQLSQTKALVHTSVLRARATIASDIFPADRSNCCFSFLVSQLPLLSFFQRLLLLIKSSGTPHAPDPSPRAGLAPHYTRTIGITWDLFGACLSYCINCLSQ